MVPPQTVSAVPPVYTSCLGASQPPVKIISPHHERASVVALTSLRRPEPHVLLCCAKGRRRSAALAYFLLRRQGQNPEDALSVLRHARPSLSTIYFDSAERAVPAGQQL